MTLRTIITIILIFISIPMLIVWKYWEGCYYNFNLWVNIDYPLNVQWAAKFVGIHLRDFLLSFAIFRMSKKIQSIRVMAICNLVYSVMDFGLFFWSFNRGKDVLLVHFTVTAVVSMVIVFWGYLIKPIKALFYKLFYKHKLY